MTETQAWQGTLCLGRKKLCMAECIDLGWCSVASGLHRPLCLGWHWPCKGTLHCAKSLLLALCRVLAVPIDIGHCPWELIGFWHVVVCHATMLLHFSLTIGIA